MKFLSNLILIMILFTGLVIGQENEDKKEKDLLSSSTFSGLKFRSIGPALASGRITDFAVNPDKNSEYYVAVASGGVWKTTNNGTTWKPLFDKQGSYSIGCVTLDPNNPFVVWIGTGENNSQRSVSYGDGVYHSNDGGKSWKNVGLKKSEHIGKIIIDPRDSRVVYVAAQGPLWGPGGDRGLYKTTDWGETWELVLEISENTGVTDIVMDPRNPDVIYAASYQRRRHVFTLINGGPESAIYKSTDAGKTWYKLKSGLPTGDIGRIGLAISPVNPDVLYAIIEAAEKKGGFFRSTNRGATWKKRDKYIATSPQYYHEIVCDPKNVDRVYSLDTRTKVTNDGGKTFNNLGNNKRHVDDHAMWIDPDDTDHYLIGGDGGIYESFDRAENWQFKANLPITQFYRVTVDNSEPFYFVYGGTQDNATLGGPSRTTWNKGIINSDWYVTKGGDGFESQIDPENPNIVYSQSQYGWLVRYNKETGESMGIKPQERKGEDSYRWNWDSPLIISPHSNTRLYFAANKLFRSDDRGNSWEVISDDLTKQLDRNKLKVMGKVWSVDAVSKNASTSLYGNIVSLTESPLKEGLIYIGTDDGLINVTSDGGLNWKKIDKFPDIPELSYVSCIFASQHDANTVYASFDNHKYADFKPYLLKSTNAGESWISVSNNLPDNGPVYTIAEDFINPNLIFVGTEFGVFFTIDSGEKWIQLKSGLPTIAVKDIDIQERESDLVLGTFGRSFYILDDYSPLREVTTNLLESENHIFKIKDALLFIPSSVSTWSQGSSFYAAENPPFGATFTYYSKDSIKTKKQTRQENEKNAEKEKQPIKYPPFDELRQEDNELKPYLLFTIYDEDGNTVRKLKSAPKKGVNRITWDLRYPATTPAKESENELSNGQGWMRALPGTYFVSLSQSVNGVITDLVAAQPFNLVSLGASTLPSAEQKALANFQKKLGELRRVVVGTERTAQELLKKIKLIKQTLHITPNAPDKLLYDAIEIEKAINEIFTSLNGDMTIRHRNENAPPSISGRLNVIVYDQWRTSSAPTQTQMNNYAIVAEELKPQLDKLRQIIEVDLKNLEVEMDKAEAPWTPGRIPVFDGN